MIIRKMTAADIAAGLRLCRLSGWNQVEEDWRCFLEPAEGGGWLAEKDGEIVGSVFLITHSKAVAQLRLMLVEPKARGLGIGARLVDECILFAREKGYRKITLWTNSILLAARHIYKKAGFRLVHKERHTSFGHALVGETWDLTL